MSLHSVKQFRPDGRLVQLVYRSTSTTGVASGLQMSDILAQARPRNAELGITGALTAVNGVFLQVVEGPELAIETLLKSLFRDRRHTGLLILEKRFSGPRAFAEWDMISPRLVGVEAAQVDRLLQDVVTDIDRFISVLLKAIARQEAVLEGVESPVGIARIPASKDDRVRRIAGESEA